MVLEAGPQESPAGKHVFGRTFRHAEFPALGRQDPHRHAEQSDRHKRSRAEALRQTAMGSYNDCHLQAAVPPC